MRAMVHDEFGSADVLHLEAGQARGKVSIAI
jgi:hypothetical protein